MKLRHQLKGQTIERELDSTAPLGFFLSNKSGGMLFFDATNDKTQYYANINGKSVKVIHDLNSTEKIAGVNNKFYSLEVTRDKQKHEVFVPHYMNALSLTSNSSDTISEPLQLVFEVKDILQEKSNVHSVEQKQGRILIKSTSSVGQSMYTAIQGEKLSYSYSIQPKNGTAQMLLDFVCPKITIATSDNEAEAITLANHLFVNEQKIKDVQESLLLQSKKFKDPEAGLAYTCALNCTDQSLFHILSANTATTIPFFSRVTSPHQSIATHALLLEGEFKLVKTALIQELSTQHKSFASGTGVMEKAAWPALLFGKLLNNLCSSGKLYTYFRPEELKQAAVQIAQLVSFAEDENSKKPDVSLESKVLLLSMYDLAYALTKSEKYKESEQKLRQQARQALEKTTDTIKQKGHATHEDARALFLAAYVYPFLMENDEWKLHLDSLLDNMHNTFNTFNTKMLKKEKNSNLKLEMFGLQNLAAVVLKRLDVEKYEKIINDILRSSVNNVLYKGIIGRPTSAYDQSVDPETEALIEDEHILNNALFLEMLRECA